MPPSKLTPGAPFVLPRAQAQAAMNGFTGRDPNMGQGAGPPGMGYEPILSHQPGGDVVTRLVHPSFEIVDILFQTLPEEGFFDPSVSSQRPIQFELGSFTVPPDQHLWMSDYEFGVQRLDGVDAGSFLPLEEGRFSGVMGFDINFSGRRLSNLLFELDPVPQSALGRPTFQVPPGFTPGLDKAPIAQFNRASANSFAANASPGTSLLPVRSRHYGPREMPFTLIAQQGARVSLNCVIFNPIPSPIASIRGEIMGHLIHGQVSSSIINRVRAR